MAVCRASCAAYGRKRIRPQPAREKPDDDAVHRLVAMPPDRRAGPVFAHQDVHEGGRRQREMLRHLVAKRNEKRRERTAAKGIRAAVVVRRRVVAVVEMRHPALGEVLAELGLAQRQRRDGGEQRPFLFAREKIGLVDEALRELALRVEEAGLFWRACDMESGR